MHLRAMIFLPLALFFAAIAGCGSEEQAAPESLTAAYADLLSYRHASASLDSASYARGVDSILTAHGYDRASFAEAFDKLGTSADEVNEFFGSVSSRLIPASPPRQRPQ